jgi:hypothetical protein
MQSIQIDGTYTYAENVCTLRLGDMIRLEKNSNNRINTEAIGAYIVKTGKKIGYVPFKASQIDIKAKYKVTKILHGQVLISREYEVSNIVEVQPKFVKEIIVKNNLKIRNQDLKDFKKFLEKSGIDILDCVISWQNENFINIMIITPEQITTFYTVTKKYYEDHVFQYDELYAFNLIPHNIFLPFQIHRIEIYIEKNYKPIEKILKKYSILKNMIQNICIEKIPIQSIKNIDNINKLKMAVQYTVSGNKEYDVGINIEKTQYLDNCKLGGIAYNHKIKAYCYVDLYNDNEIIEITYNWEPSDSNILEMIVRANIANKKTIIIIDYKGTIYRFNSLEI